MSEKFGLKIGIEGEKEYKKSLADINQSFKVLGSEMKLVSSEFDKNDKSIEALTARNTVLEKQISSQKDKIETLRAALDNAAASFGENDKRTQNWQIKLNNAEAELNNLEREVKKNNEEIKNSEDCFEGASKDAKKFADNVDDVGNKSNGAKGKLSNLGGTLKNIGGAMAAAATAVGAAVATGKKLFSSIQETTEYGDEVDKVSQKLGMSAEGYQKWDYVLSQSGVEITSMTTGLKTLTNQIDDAKNGSAQAQERFKKLGLSVEDLNKMSREEAFEATIKGFQQMEDSTERAALANDLFGKSGQNLTPLFNQTNESTQQLMETAQKYGFVMSNDAVKASAKFHDSMDTLNRTMTGFKNNMMAEFLPGVTSITDGFADLIIGEDKASEKIESGITEVIGKVSELIPKFVGLIGTLAGAILESAPAVINALIEGILTALPQLSEAAVQLIIGLAQTLIDNLPTMMQAAIQVINTLVMGLANAMPALIPAIVQGILGMVKAILDNLPSFINAGIQMIVAIIQGIVNSIPLIIEMLPSIIESLINALIESLPLILEGIVMLVTAIIEALPDIIRAIAEALPHLISIIVEALPQLINTLITAIVMLIPTIIQALIDCLPALIQGLIDLIMGIVQALPMIIKALIGALPNIIASVITALIECLPQLIQGFIDLVVGLVEHLPEIIMGIIEALPDIISAVIDALIECLPQLIEGSIRLVIELVKHLPEIIIGLIKAIPKIVVSIAEGFMNCAGKLVEVGGNLIKGLWQGIKDAGAWLWEKISGFFGGIVDRIKDFFGIHSPSTLFKNKIGKNLALGLGVGFVDEMNKVSKEMQKSIPTDFDASINTNIDPTSSKAMLYANGSKTNNPVFNNNISFGSVTINGDKDIETIANKVSDFIVADVMRKGGAYA